MIILCVLWLFLDPVIKLMGDLRTKSVDLVELQTSARRLSRLSGGSALGSSKIPHGDSSSSESEMEPTTDPHSPTKMGGAYYRGPATRTTVTPTRTRSPDARESTRDVTVQSTEEHTEIDTKIANMRFGRLPCPEDENETLKPIEEAKRSKFKFGGFGFRRNGGYDDDDDDERDDRHRPNWNVAQMQILNTGTRLALLSVVSLSSGFIYQVLWMISVRQDRLYDFTYTFAIDTVLSLVFGVEGMYECTAFDILYIYILMVVVVGVDATDIACIYLSFQFAEREYNVVCLRVFKCHNCCLRRLEHMARKRGI